MAKKSNRQSFPFICEHCGRQIWLETNTQNNRLNSETSKLGVKKFCNHLTCRVHRIFTQAKRPATIQQGGKKKR